MGKNKLETIEMILERKFKKFKFVKAVEFKEINIKKCIVKYETKNASDGRLGELINKELELLDKLEFLEFEIEYHPQGE